MPRPPGLVSIGVAISVGLLITLPLETLFNVSAETDTFGLVPFIRLSEALNGGVSEARTLIGIGAICAAILFATVPRTVAAWAIPLAVGAFLITSSGSVWAKETYIASDPPCGRARRGPELDRPRNRDGQARRVPLHDRH